MSALTDAAKHRLEELLTFFGINATVEAEQDDQSIDLSVETEDSGRLIGHRGETLAALQHLMNMIMQSYSQDRLYVHIDVGGYKKARVERLVAQAREKAAEVLEEGSEAMLPPMNAAERRLVHMELKSIEGIISESRGEGPRRRLVIVKAD